MSSLVLVHPKEKRESAEMPRPFSGQAAAITGGEFGFSEFSKKPF
jgi:hypothetical protein